MEWIEKVHEEYQDHYVDFRLVGSYQLYVPFYKVGLSMEYSCETGLNLIEEYVCRALECGVDNVRDIADVLSLTEDMVLHILTRLRGNGYVLESTGEYSFTASGKKLFEHRVKHESKNQTLTLFYDGLTPEYKIEFFGKQMEHKLLKYREIASELREHVLQPQTFPEYDERIHFNALSQRVLEFTRNEMKEEEGLSGENVIKINHFSLEPGREVYYHEYLILVYRNQQNRYNLLAYDPCGLCFIDQRVTQSLQELMEKDQLRTIQRLSLPATNDVNYIVEALKNYARSSDALALNEQVRTEVIQRIEDQQLHIASKYIMNAEIRQKFLHYLKHAEESLYIISPWMNMHVVNSSLMADLEGLLKRGVQVTIIYGIQSPDQESSRRDQKTEQLANKLLKKFGDKYAGNFRITYGHTHEKLLICDRKYYINGSFNFLSYAGEDDGFFRNEGSTYSEDTVLIEETIRLRFNLPEQPTT